MPKNKGKEAITSETTFIIVGAGPSGLFSARALKKLGVPTQNITILEQQPWVGGKCHTYTDPDNPDLTTEFGAELIAHNYGVVLDAIQEKGVQLEEVLPTKINSINFMKQFYEKDKLGKLTFSAQFAQELISYEAALRNYEYIRDNQLPLPKEYELPFAEFAKLKGLTKLNDLLRPLVTGFGYGAMQVCPTFAIFEYLGHTTIPAMQMIPTLLSEGPFYGIKGGFQRLMEAVAADFNVLTSVEIFSIDRTDGICVSFLQQGEKIQLKADYLILALSPLHWKKLGLNLSETEKACTENLSYYRYNVAVCHLKGYPPQQEFFEHGLQPQGFGDLALITSRDARPDPEEGRLCSVYINLPPGENNYHLELGAPECQKLESELTQVEGVTEAKIIKIKTWEDYLSLVPWKLRRQLHAEQFTSDLHTGYVNSCLSFEDVACVANFATDLIAKQFALNPKQIYDVSLGTEIRRMWTLFAAKKNKPVSTDQKITFDSPKETEQEIILASQEEVGNDISYSFPRAPYG
ncbi:protoporphyrinogen oxidase [Legionella lansingensis]|uniref:Protoporphyrinogen oxidase n=1 Tax=Legionella lansingensis TaxID=45067 RepID=A0A0W0VFE9_9GAMM|nr:FAD-dependent oxidoreductase [Legionella lansingensis]KTD18621.1 protoporphyrinogen oxidase [Legionella lansingensis]SNV46200.1 protoporphyrinogen oxidase [Legionella lansingensis]